MYEPPIYSSKKLLDEQNKTFFKYKTIFNEEKTRMDKNNFTTALTGVLLALFSYLGISQATSNILLQALAPFISIAIAYIMSYFNEKYPSSWVTSVSILNDTGTGTEDEDGI